MDHHAAAPLCEAAKQAMDEARDRAWANPASVHGFGRAARTLLERARDQVAASVGARPTDVVFTSGGTEACNLGILGLINRPRGAHVVTTEIEHPAVAKTTEWLEREGAQVTELSVNGGAPPDGARLLRALRPDTALVAVQWVNHETGTLLPIAEYADVCAEAGVPLFVDGTQALGKVPVDVSAIPVSCLALASHKVGGPGGAGALIVRRSCEMHARQLGGGQERGRRAGTPGVETLVGFGAACTGVDTRIAAQPAITRLRDELERALIGLGARINGAEGPRVATVVNGSFEGLRGADMVAALDLAGLNCASGAACSSGLAEPSGVLRAMYPGDQGRALGALRLSLGPESEGLDANHIGQLLRTVIMRMRG